MNNVRFIVAICGDGKLGIRDLTSLNEYTSERQVADYMNRITNENEQLKQQIKIFEKFLEVNDLGIDWEEFCGVDECAFENPDFCCQECTHLKGDVE